MNFLNVFEQRVGGLFGATAQGLTAPFSFKKLAKKAAREMESETFVIDGVDTAPALFTILVSSEDDLAMRPLYAQLTHECAQFIEGQAQNKGYVFVGRPVVRFMADPSLKSGRFSVFAENVDVQTLNRLREEEARFMGAEPPYEGSLGGAASPLNQPAPVMQPPLTGSEMHVSNMASGELEAGLDVLPQEAVFDAEEAARGQVRQYQNVPLVNSRQQPMAMPAQSAYPQSQAQGPIFRPAAPAPIPQPVATADDSFAAPAPVRGAHAAPAAAYAAPVAAAAAATPVAMGAHAAQAAAPRRGAHAAPQGTPATVRVAPAVPAPPAAPATCLLIDRQSGRTYTAAAPRTVIGRERTPGGVVLHDPNVSRNHAELSFDGATWHIRDLNSTNGTLVNDVDVDECALQDGDLITLGLVTLEFRES